MAREKNFTRAAEILHVSQPSLSKQIKELENELEKKLFIRQTSGIKLTSEGEFLKNRVADIIALTEKTVAEIKADEIIGGEIYFGLAESHLISYLAKEIKNLKKIYPNLHYHITSGDTEQIIEKLDNGILDFVVLAEQPDVQKYNFLEFPAADEWGLIIPKNDKLAEKNFIQFEDLIGLPLFCSGQAWKKEIANWCNGRIDELFLECSLKLSYNESIFVKENLGYLLTFDKLIDVSAENNLVFRSLFPKLETKLFLTWKKFPKFSPIAEKFLDKIKKFISDISLLFSPNV
ncbi:MAG: LysR family transcriptional regulator [Selenomonadaceae bacterium]|nr:LysR family transcriptional regulator [Selenomonadaceae bacterium]